MLPSSMLPMPATWGDLLGELGPVFRRRSTYQLFVLLACGMILAGRRTVVAMAAAAGIADQFRRACWFFSGAVWDIDDLGLAVAGLIVKYLVPAGAPVTVAAGGTFFKRRGRSTFIWSNWAWRGCDLRPRIVDMSMRNALPPDTEQRAAATRGLAQVTWVTPLRVRRRYPLQITVSTTRFEGPSTT